ncbi:MAG: trigger factor [Spirochaetaceae bacterium]|nr:trigger factor [Spirochaetaceae bacterium]
MKVTKEITTLENSAVSLTIKVGKKDVAACYNDVVAKHAKTIQIPGFRKGKAPISVLEKKFGDALKAEATSELIENALEIVFGELDKEKSDNRPLPYAQPELKEMPEFNVAKDFEFAVIYDVFPKVAVTNFADITIKEPQVKIGDTELNEELQAIRERNAMVLDKKDNDAAAKDDIATINYCELDENNAEIAGSHREDFVFTIGTGENIYKIDDDIIGMKINETKEITKTFADDDANKDLAGQTKKIKVTVKALKVRNLPELDDELAQDVNEKYKTLDDMKADIKKNLETAKENRIRELKSSSLIEQLVEKNPVELPKSMVEAELNSRWRMMAQRFQTTVEQLDKMVAASGQKKEDMLKEWTGDAEKMLKGRIIVESLLIEKNISVSDEEVDAEMQKIADGANISLDEVKKHYENPQQKEYLIDDMKEQKLYTELFQQVKVTKGDKMTFADLFKQM